MADPEALITVLDAYRDKSETGGYIIWEPSEFMQALANSGMPTHIESLRADWEIVGTGPHEPTTIHPLWWWLSIRIRKFYRWLGENG